jgi:hypothetical protein
MADRVKDWCKRHAGWLAIIFAVLALVLFGVVCVQAWMLHSRGWRIALGTVPEWGSAAFTGIAAIGVLAAFGTCGLSAGNGNQNRLTGAISSRTRRD